MIPSDWIAHRRSGDRELVGYLIEQADGEHYQPVNAFGYPLGDAQEIIEAMEVVERDGMSSLAWRWRLSTADRTSRVVKIHQVSPARLTVVVDDFAAIEAIGSPIAVPIPVGDHLIPA